MTASKLLTTTVAALTVVGAGLVYAQTTATPPGPGNTPSDQMTNQAPPATTTAPGATTNNMPATSTPAQDTTQRSTTTVPMDAQADRN
jgi:hypothetical protein